MRFPVLYSFAFTTYFPLQVTSTWQVWPKACTATSQSSWPPGMASRAVWHLWTWTGACQTSSMMPSIGADRLSVAVKVYSLLFRCAVALLQAPSLSAASASAPFLSLPVLSDPTHHPTSRHHQRPPVIADWVCEDMCHRLQECMLADVSPVSHTCWLRTCLGTDIGLLLTCVFASSVAERGTSIYALTHGEV